MTYTPPTVTTHDRPEGAFPSVPRTLASEPAVNAREQLLTRPHHAPLAAYVLQLRERMRVRGLDVPHFDPLGRGVQARVLYLLEAPGPKAARTHGGSGFVSMDNNDPTAQNTFAFTRDAELDRAHVLAWNIVPWYVGSGDKIRPVTREEIQEGREHLRELLAWLPDVRVVVTFGAPAAKGWTPLAGQFARVTTLATWHTSGLALNAHPERRAHVLDTLRLARQLALHAFDPRGPK